MSESIGTDPARELVGRAIRGVVPDADLDSVDEDTDLRRAFELDSLDFLGFVELLSRDSGVRLDEEDYPELATLARCRALLVRRTTARD